MYEKIPVTHTHVPARETERELTRRPPRAGARRGGPAPAGAVTAPASWGGRGRGGAGAPAPRAGARGASLRTSAKRETMTKIYNMHVPRGHLPVHTHTTPQDEH